MKRELSYATLNIKQLNSKWDEWQASFPNITPFYAVKCNPHRSIVEKMIALGSNFDCASKEEIKLVLQCGAKPDQIIFANPMKFDKDILYAKKVHVNLTVFDCEEELLKIHSLYPECQLLLRVKGVGNDAQCPLSDKYGCNEEVAFHLLTLAAELKIPVIGVSFHVGSGCFNPQMYHDTLKRVSKVMDFGKEAGLPMNIIDIGGGFPGFNEGSLDFSIFANVIQGALKRFFLGKDYKLIAEPGRFFAGSLIDLHLSVIGKRVHKNYKTNQVETIHYFLSDGLYGYFNNILYDHSAFAPKIEKKKVLNLEKESESVKEIVQVKSTFWGPTCDSADMMARDIMFPELEIGDSLVFENMGAYTSACAKSFNGIPLPNLIINQ